MAKKPTKEAEDPQIKRFREAVRDMVAAGALNPTEADERFARIVKSSNLNSSQ